MEMCDGENKPIKGKPKHGDNAWSKGDMIEYKYSDKGEGWLMRRDFERKYSTLYALE